MSGFTLIDLFSQREAVLTHVQGWQPNQIIDWMRQYGRVERVTQPYDTGGYLFYSSSGEVTPFRFSEGGSLVIQNPYR